MMLLTMSYRIAALTDDYHDIRLYCGAPISVLRIFQLYIGQVRSVAANRSLEFLSISR